MLSPKQVLGVLGPQQLTEVVDYVRQEARGVGMTTRQMAEQAVPQQGHLPGASGGMAPGPEARGRRDDDITQGEMDSRRSSRPQGIK